MGTRTNLIDTSQFEVLSLAQFRLLQVTRRETIRRIVEGAGLSYRTGSVFCLSCVSAREQGVGSNKQVILCHRETGQLFTGDNVRICVGLPIDAYKKLPPFVHPDFDLYVETGQPDRSCPINATLLYRMP